jgi:outer membrane murein-binding lipoprotein Lpp
MQLTAGVTLQVTETRNDSVDRARIAQLESEVQRLNSKISTLSASRPSEGYKLLCRLS